MSVDEWRNNPHRAALVRTSLTNRCNEMRAHASRARRAFNKAYMGEPANYLADAYDEAAAVFQRKLDECQETVVLEQPPSGVFEAPTQAQVERDILF